MTIAPPTPEDLCVRQHYRSVSGPYINQKTPNRPEPTAYDELPTQPTTPDRTFYSYDPLPHMITGQERDSENTPALDYFNARYMASVLGRFASPDPGNAVAVLTNPQSWNGYSYALNNPLAIVDPSGLCSLGPDGYYHDDPGEPCVAAGQTTTTVDGGSPDPIEIVPIEIPNPGITPGNNPTVTSVPNQAGDPAKTEPCANSALSAAGVNIQQRIALTNSLVSAQYSLGNNSGGQGNGTLGALYAYYSPVHTGGPFDDKNHPGPGTAQQRIDAGNISFGATCPFGATFCQAAAGGAQA